MTLKKAITIAKKRVKIVQELIKDVEDEKQKNPDDTKEQLSANMYRIVLKMAENETVTLKKILRELESKTKSKSKNT